jgi:UDP-2,4-diacetamido-2,4,6-trideoxy-beta-L-altropyranose hydrolase
MTLKDSALDPLTILIRCDASHQLGFGHVVRCLALADELSESYGCSVSFAMRGNTNGFKAVHEKGYSVITPINTEAFDYKTWIKSAIHDTEAKALILDVRDDLPREVLKELKSEKNILLVTIDDPSDRRLNADLAFYPPAPQVQQMDWTGFNGKLYTGWVWLLLRREFSKRPTKIKNKRPMLLITMGGSDPQGMTLKAVSALNLLENDFDTVIVTGPGFQHRQKLNKLLSKVRRHFVVKENVTAMAELMAGSDLAIASFGVTSYELAACGVPAIYLCLTEDHAESATSFAFANMGVSLGLCSNVSNEDLALSISSLLDNPLQRLSMKTKAENLVNGCGVKKVAQIIKSETELRQQIEYKSDKTKTFK